MLKSFIEGRAAVETSTRQMGPGDGADDMTMQI